MKYEVKLIAFSPLLDEDSLDAAGHLRFIEFVLKLYGTSTENIVCLIGDNCRTNRALADLSKLTFIGCISHRFNLADKQILMTN